MFFHYFFLKKMNLWIIFEKNEFQSIYVFWDQRNYSGLKVKNFWKMKWKMSRLRVILNISKSFRKKIIFFKLIFWGLSNPLIFTISHTHSHTPWLTARYLFQKGRAFHRSFGFSKLVLYSKNINSVSVNTKKNWISKHFK